MNVCAIEGRREHFEHQGYLIERGLFCATEVDGLLAAFMAQNADGPIPGLSEINPNYSATDPLSRYPRMMHPHKHLDKLVGQISTDWMLDPRIQSVLTALFNEEPIAAQSMFYFKPPGARGQDLHQDNFYLRVHPGTCIAAWVALDRADEENGGLIVVPGTQKLPVACPERADPSRFFTTDHLDVPGGLSIQTAMMEPGDVLFFNGSLIHGSYENKTTDRFRRAFICHYVPASCQEVSGGYRPLLRFDGSEVSKSGASGGGPCGTSQGPTGLH